MDKDAVLLAILSVSKEERQYPLDPVRVMKGAFLVSQLGSEELRDKFTFEPYDYGPFDPSVYDSIRHLAKRNFINEVKGGGSKYPYYLITETGLAELTQYSRKEITWLKSVGDYVTSRSFTNLLSEIYTKFPAFAEKSVFKK